MSGSVASNGLIQTGAARFRVCVSATEAAPLRTAENLCLAVAISWFRVSEHVCLLVSYMFCNMNGLLNSTVQHWVIHNVLSRIACQLFIGPVRILGHLELVSF